MSLISMPPRSKYAKILTINSSYNCFVVMHLFPVHFPVNRLKHPTDCTIVKVV